MLQIFKGCHGDSLKITMYLREILFRNFKEIVEEVSLICGGFVSDQIISFAYDESSLVEQFRMTEQTDTKKVIEQDFQKMPESPSSLSPNKSPQISEYDPNKTKNETNNNTLMES